MILVLSRLPKKRPSLVPCFVLALASDKSLDWEMKRAPGKPMASNWRCLDDGGAAVGVMPSFGAAPVYGMMPAYGVAPMAAYGVQPALRYSPYGQAPAVPVVVAATDLPPGWER